MRKWFGRLVFGALAIGGIVVAGQASAAMLVSSSFDFALGNLPAPSFLGSGATGTATSNLSASLGAGTAFNDSFTASIASSVAPPFTKIQVNVTKNAGNTFTGTTPSNVGGNLAVEGAAYVYGLGGSTFLAVPLKIGTPNTIFNSFSNAALGASVAITAIAAGWTVGATTITGVTDTFTPGTAMVTGANGLTPNGAGTLVLVTPLKILTNYVSMPTVAAFGTLTLTYVPEPGTLLLLGTGIAGLTALRRRRR